MILEVVFKVRIVYKSGYTHDFECTDFEMTESKVTWKSVSERNRPIKIGFDEIAAVWQIGHRKRIKFFGK